MSGRILRTSSGGYNSANSADPASAAPSKASSQKQHLRDGLAGELQNFAPWYGQGGRSKCNTPRDGRKTGSDMRALARAKRTHDRGMRSDVGRWPSGA